MPDRLSCNLRMAMRGVAMTVAIVTTGDHHAPVVLTATSVTSVSLDPPSLLVCVNRSTRLHRAIGISGVFRVSFLRVGQEEIAAAFGSSHGTRFATGDWDFDVAYGPHLSGAMASLGCRLEHLVDQGTHTIFFGAVCEVEMSVGPPLLYHNGNYTAVAA